jgi:PHD/YefM family antitoxin component YafN of YafNO toxin-antitoxin module
MNTHVQIIVTATGERLVVIPEVDYNLLISASEDHEGDVKPEFMDELRRRRASVAVGNVVSHKKA